MTRSIKRQGVMLLVVASVLWGCGGSSGSNNDGNGGSTTNIPIATAAGSQGFPELIGNGAGGAIIVWQDLRSGAPDIYAQRVNSAWVPQWAANGVAVTTAVNAQYSHQLVTDGAGGAIIVWEDARSGTTDIYAQRVDSVGVPKWTANGVAISTAAGSQSIPRLVADGAGGAIIVWQDNRSGTTGIYAQRVDSVGVPQWTADGLAITTVASLGGSPQLVADGAGGAIITWYEVRGGTSWDIYAQRVNGTGVLQWTAGGVPISSAADSQSFPQVVADGAGGAIIVWDDRRSGARSDIYAQRIDSAGIPQWTADGVAICTAAGDHQRHPQLIADGAGGVIIAWQDFRSGTTEDIYAQRVDSAGVPQWTANGVAVSTAQGDQFNAQLAVDGAGGAIIVWTDDRREVAGDIYAQRVDSTGAPQWTPNGIAISTAAGFQGNQQLIADGAGGAIVVWADGRGAIPDPFNIYAQGITYSGLLK